jgi:hypothetical protein
MPVFYVNKSLAQTVRRIAKRDRSFASEYLFDALKYAPLGASPVLCEGICDALIALTDEDIRRGTNVIVRVNYENMD